jgi:hypothetical protein
MKPTMTRVLPTARGLVVVPVLATMILVGCSPSQRENNGSQQSAQSSASDSQTLVKPPHLGEVAEPIDSNAATPEGPRRPPVAKTAEHSLGTIPMKARRGEAPASESLTVASFLDRSIATGQRVQVTGTCLDQFHARASAGPPPVSRSDWQLTSGDQVVYVVGRMPRSCATGPTTISATVAFDTSVIAGQRRPRRYLIVSR